MGSYFFVVITTQEDKWDQLSLIIHESVHVFQQAMKYLGETAYGDELPAYSIEKIAINLAKDFYALSEKRETGL